MSRFDDAAIALHLRNQGKWEIRSKFNLTSDDDLSLAYTPGVAAVSKSVSADANEAFRMTMKGNSVAIVSDGSAVLGLGDIGPLAALPVMEGKAILLKELADVDGIPIVINASTPDEIVTTVRSIAPTFGGINLEDIKAPKCFEVEERLQDLGIPVFHDDQHGTAIVLLAGLLNACKVTGKRLEELTVVINGAGAAGAAIAKLLRCIGHHPDRCTPVRKVYLCDTKGAICQGREDLHPYKRKLLAYTNPDDRKGSLFDLLQGADVFIGVSVGSLLTADQIQTMAKNPIIMAMANPIPEIMPEEAKRGGAAIVGTGRSDLPNQVNNASAFPGIFRGAINVRATQITEGMKLAAAQALAESVPNPTVDNILPSPLDKSVPQKIATAVAAAAIRDGVAAIG